MEIEIPDDLPQRLEDAFYISVGLGVLAVQRAQVKRRELERAAARAMRWAAADRSNPPGSGSAL